MDEPRSVPASSAADEKSSARFPGSEDSTQQHPVRFSDPDDFPEPHMEPSLGVPSAADLDVAAAEQRIAEVTAKSGKREEQHLPCTCGYDARNNERDSDSNCPSHKAWAGRMKALQLIDTPGVGVVRTTLPGHPYIVGEVPETLRDCVDDLNYPNVQFTERRCTLCGAPRLSTGVCSRIAAKDQKGGCSDSLHDLRAEQKERRDELLGQLIMASRDMAVAQIGNSGVLFCSHCNCAIDKLFGGTHAPLCENGRVLEILGELISITESSVQLNPRREESVEHVVRTAADLNAAGPAETPAQQNLDERDWPRYCPVCGKGDYNWTVELVSPFEFRRKVLSANILSIKRPWGVEVHTHQCALGGAA